MTTRELSKSHDDNSNLAISLIAPMYNESANIDLFYRKIIEVLDGLDCNWEIICVNDGSKDDTLVRLLQLHQRDKRIKIVDFSRNFGKEMALSAGLEYASGRIVIPIDSDLQHPPEAMLEMIEKWQQGADIVFGVRRSREKENFIKRVLTKVFYKVFGSISGIPNHNKIGDFCLLDRNVVNVIKLLPERNRFMKGLFAWGGFRQEYVIYDLQERHAGKTKWNYWRLWNFALEGITSFSTIPLRIWTYVGFTFAIAALLYAAWIIYVAMSSGINVPGYASLMVVLLFLGGMQLVSLGIFGEYIGRIYIEVKGRPMFLVRKAYGIKPDNEHSTLVLEQQAAEQLNAHKFNSDSGHIIQNKD